MMFLIVHTCTDPEATGSLAYGPYESREAAILALAEFYEAMSAGDRIRYDFNEDRSCLTNNDFMQWSVQELLTHESLIEDGRGE